MAISFLRNKTAKFASISNSDLAAKRIITFIIFIELYCRKWSQKLHQMCITICTIQVLLYQRLSATWLGAR